MNALADLRQELRALLGPTVFLRRDREARALFICDAPRRLDDPEAARRLLAKAGFETAEDGALWRIDLAPARRAAFLAAVPPGAPPCDPALRSLCRSLLARGETPPEAQPWPPVRLTLLLLDAGEHARLRRELSAQTALLKRLHAPLPTAAAHLIENHCTEGEPPC